MSTTYQEIQELIVRTVGVEDVKKLHGRYVENKQALEDLSSAYDRGAVHSEVYRRELKALEAQQTRLVGEMRRGVAGLETAASGMSDYRQRITGLGYALNDFLSVQGSMQQRLNAIANNMPMLFAGFSGLGLALSALLPVIGMVAGNWDQLKAAFGGTFDEGIDRLETLKAKIKELESKDHKIPVDIIELENAKKEIEAIKNALAAVEKIRKSQAHYEKEAGAGVEKILTEPTTDEGKAVSGDELYREIKAQRVKELLATSGELEAAKKEQAEQQALAERLKQARETAHSVEELEAVNAQLIPALEAADLAGQKIQAIISGISREGTTEETSGVAQRQVGAVIEKAKTGTGAAQAQARGQLGGMLRKAGFKQMAESVEISSPEFLQEQEKTAEKAEESGQAQRDARKAADEAKRKRDQKDREAARAEAEAASEQRQQAQQLARDVTAENKDKLEKVAADTFERTGSMDVVRDALIRAAAAAIGRKGLNPTQAADVAAQVAEPLALRAPELVAAQERKADTAGRKKDAAAKREAAKEDREALKDARALAKTSQLDEWARDRLMEGNPAPAVANAVAQFLFRAGYDPDDAGRTATAIVTKAFEDLQDKILGDMAGGPGVKPGRAGAPVGGFRSVAPGAPEPAPAETPPNPAPWLGRLGYAFSPEFHHRAVSDLSHAAGTSADPLPESEPSRRLRAMKEAEGAAEPTPVPAPGPLAKPAAKTPAPEPVAVPPAAQVPALTLPENVFAPAPTLTLPENVFTPTPVAPPAKAAKPFAPLVKDTIPQWAVDATGQRDEDEAKLKRSPTVAGRVARAKARREAKAAALARRKAAAQARRDRRGRGASGAAVDYQAAREATGGGSVSGPRSGPSAVDREFQGIDTRDMLNTALGGSESERAAARAKAAPRQPSAADRAVARIKAKEHVTPADAGQAQVQAPPPVPPPPVAATPSGSGSPEANWIKQREAWLKARDGGEGKAGVQATEQTQQAMGATQQAMGATIGQLQTLQANAKKLMDNARRLERQTGMRGNTFLDSGSPGS